MRLRTQCDESPHSRRSTAIELDRKRLERRSDLDLTDEWEGCVRHRWWIIAGVGGYRRLHGHRSSHVGSELGGHDFRGEESSVGGLGAEGELQYPRLRHGGEGLSDQRRAGHRELRLLREQRQLGHLRHLRHLRRQHRAQSRRAILVGCPGTKI